MFSEQSEEAGKRLVLPSLLKKLDTTITGLRDKHTFMFSAIFSSFPRKHPSFRRSWTILKVATSRPQTATRLADRHTLSPQLDRRDASRFGGRLYCSLTILSNYLFVHLHEDLLERVVREAESFEADEKIRVIRDLQTVPGICNSDDRGSSRIFGSVLD